MSKLNEKDKNLTYLDMYDFQRRASFPFFLRGPLPFQQSRTPTPEDLWTPPPDPRFQENDKATMCFTYFMDHLRCKFHLGEEHPDCEYLDKTTHAICPQFWLDKWADQLERGVHPKWKTPEVKYKPCDNCNCK